MTKKLLTITSSIAALVLLSACAPKNDTTSEAPAEAKAEMAAELAVMDAVIGGEWRTEQAARDGARNPKETLAFFGLEPGHHVVEIAPGGGWYTTILAPYVHQTGGTYTATTYDPAAGERAVAANARFAENFSDSTIYGAINTAPFGATTEPFTNGDADLVLSFRNVHNWMGGGYADKAFADFYTALKPGGILGIVEHRLPETAEQNPQANTGYVQVSYTKALAAKAGFEFVGASEINANSKDTADHPVGVWTLPPRSATPQEGSEHAEGFDAAKYLAIGESDRYTLKFRKPTDAKPALEDGS